MALSDLVQRGKDGVLLLKSSRKHQVWVLGIAALVALYLVMNDSPPRGGKRALRQPTPQRSEQRVQLGTAATENYADLMRAISGRQEQMVEQITQIRDDLQVTKDTISQNEQTTAKIFNELMSRMTNLQRATMLPGPVANMAGPTEPGTVMPITQFETRAPAPLELESFGAMDIQEVAPPPPDEPNRQAFIGVGDSVRVQLIAGVNAPTDGTPYPTLFKLIGPVTGPDGSTLPLGEARILAAAQGSLADQRALFRLRSISLRLPDGSRSDYDIDGWVVGEDGIRGMEGELIDPFGKIIAGSMVAGTIQGAGKGLSSANTTKVISDGTAFDTVHDGGLWEYAAGVGMGKAGQRWSQLIERRMGLYVPHVKVLSGRDATAIFGRKLVIEGLYDQLVEEDQVYGF